MTFNVSKFRVKFDKAYSVERMDVCLVNESSIQQSDVEVYKTANNYLYLLDDHRIYRF